VTRHVTADFQRHRFWRRQLKMREETGDGMQSIQRHAGLLGILLERFAFQIAELALNFLQRGDKRAHIIGKDSLTTFV
jgi:hypothetical protein